MALTETISTGDVTLDGTVQELFDVGDGSTAKHFRTSILFDDFFSGNTVDISVYEYDNNENVYREWDTRQVSFSDVDPEGLSLFNFTRVSFWKFEDTLVDEEGTQNLTKTAGTETYVTGARTGKAIDLDGATYYSASDTPYDFERTNPFSYSFWLKSTAIGVLDMVLAKMSAVGGSIGQQLIIQSNEKFRMRFSGSTEATVVDFENTSARDGNWHHIALTKASGGGRVSDFKFYVDAVLQSNTSVTDTLTSESTLNNENFIIGSRTDADFILTGQLDEVMVFSTELTAEQVRMLAGSSPKSIYIPWLESTKYRVEVKRTSATYPSKIRWQRYEVT